MICWARKAFFFGRVPFPRCTSTPHEISG